MSIYNPSLYIFKTELAYQNILFGLLLNIKNGLLKSKLLKFFEESEKLSSQRNIEYLSSYWENFTVALYDCQIYKKQTAQKWMANEKYVRGYLKKCEAINESVEYGLNAGYLNSLDKVIEFESLMSLSVCILTVSFEILAIHFELFIDFRKMWNVLVNDVLNVYRDKTCKNFLIFFFI